MPNNGDNDPKSPAESIIDQIRQLAAESGAENLDDLNDIAGQVFGSYNQRPQADMGGLSPGQVQYLISPEWIGGCANLDESLPYSSIAATPYFHNARHLLRTIHTMGTAKATATGAFNRALSTQMFHDFIMDDRERRYYTEHRQVINQGDVYRLDFLRYVLPAAGLLRLAKGVFNVTKRGSDLLSEENAGRLYAAVFKTTFARMNLAAMDGLPDVPSVQRCIGYSIFQFGKIDQFVSMDDTGSRIFLPAVRDLIIENERDGRLAYFAYLRVVQHLAAFGLAEVDMPKGHSYPNSLAQPTPLFHQFIRFHLPLAPR